MIYGFTYKILQNGNCTHLCCKNIDRDKFFEINDYFWDQNVGYSWIIKFDKDLNLSSHNPLMLGRKYDCYVQYSGLNSIIENFIKDFNIQTFDNVDHNISKTERMEILKSVNLLLKLESN